MNTTRRLTYALCGCTDRHHDEPQHDAWKPTAEEAWDGRAYMPGNHTHMLRETVTVTIEEFEYPVTPIHDGPMGEIPPTLDWCGCLYGRVPNPSREGTTITCRGCGGTGLVGRVAA